MIQQVWHGLSTLPVHNVSQNEQSQSHGLSLHAATSVRLLGVRSPRSQVRERAGMNHVAGKSEAFSVGVGVDPRGPRDTASPSRGR